MLTLLQHEDQLTLLQREPTHVPQAVNEMLRYNGSVQTAAVRRPVENVTLGGIHIGEGQPVIAFIGAANRDPAVFPEPDRFDILRTGERHIAFGEGLHACIGLSLARLECEVALATLLRRWPRIRLAGSTPPRWRHHVVLRGLEQLPVHKA
jgi:cytochrome P450